MGTNLPAGFFTNKPGPLAGAGLAAMEQDRIAKLELPGAQPPETLSILDGSISPTRAAVIVDTEGGAPADDLTVISTTLSDGTMLHEGMELTIRAKDASRVIAVKNSSAVNGILTADGQDVLLGMDWWLTLRLESGSWRQKSLAQPQKVASKDNLGLMQVGQHLTVTPGGVVDAPLASESEQGMGRSATTAEVKSGVTKDDGPAYVTPETGRSAYQLLGDIRLLPFRHNKLPFGWYYMNGVRYASGTPQDEVLRGFDADFKADWGITTTDKGTNVPNFFHTDGRGPVMRAITGVDRQVGSIEEGCIQSHRHGTANNVVNNIGASAGNPGPINLGGYGTEDYSKGAGKGEFDIYSDYYGGDEMRMLNRGMTPAIFLGV